MKDIIVLYLRISMEDDAVGESDSVVNQRALLQSYVEKDPLLCAGNVIEIVDDGYSGTSFARPGVKKLFDMVEQGMVNCIIVKDFSRLGRNYIEVGNYLENVFPEKRVRFISVNDHFDSQKQNAGRLDIAFKNILYALYSKDLSQKVKSEREQKMHSGKYTSAYAIYGYKKSAFDKNKLEIDPCAARVVSRIFQMACAGSGTTAIACALGAENIPTPMQYRTGEGKAGFWTKDTITRMIRDARYMGHMVCGKRERAGIGKKNTRKIKNTDWVVIENTHQGIVDAEIFALANSHLATYKEQTKKINKTVALFGKIKCGYCGHSLRYKEKEKSILACATGRYTASELCNQNRIHKQDIVDVALFWLQKQVQIVIDKEKVMACVLRSISERLKACIQVQKEMQQRVKMLRSDTIRFYEDMREERISKEAFTQKKAKSAKEIAKLTAEIETQTQLQKILSEKLEAREEYQTAFAKNALLDSLPQGITENLIENILVYNHQQIEIVLKVKSPQNLVLAEHHGE